MTSPSSRTNLRRVLTIIAAGAVVLFVAVTLIARGGDDNVDSVVLDQPGVYQEPGIAVNEDLAGSRLSQAVLETADGTAVTVDDLLSRGRPVLINLWYSTCQPCKREMPALQAAFEEFGDRIDFVGINPQDSAATMTSFADEVGVTYELFRDPNGSFTVANGIATYPTTLLVSRDGLVIDQIAGELSDDEIRDAVSILLG
ncbi:MAG: TlpA family protein disulfide reductase [Ilumatobacteraceae bacterium]